MNLLVFIDEYVLQGDENVVKRKNITLKMSHKGKKNIPPKAFEAISLNMKISLSSPTSQRGC